MQMNVCNDNSLFLLLWEESTDGVRVKHDLVENVEQDALQDFYSVILCVCVLIAVTEFCVSILSRNNKAVFIPLR